MYISNIDVKINRKYFNMDMSEIFAYRLINSFKMGNIFFLSFYQDKINYI